VIDATGNPARILLLGGTSEIALAIAERFAASRAGIEVVLAARPSPARTAAAHRLSERGCVPVEVDFDARDRSSHATAVDAAFDGGDVDVAVVAFGVLGDQEAAWQDVDAAVAMVEVNYTAAVSTGVLLAARLRAQGHGTVVALSSVAGERPRRSNFVYGSTKAGMDAFFTGLREAVRPDGVRVVVVRPGFVHSRMTQGLTAAPLSQQPEQVARVVVEAVRRGTETVWAPAPLRLVMSVLRHVPAPVFRRLPL
jgi:decaprenylphospho-beta-D-erythro-pentofuranosid-2-ulose 2-reductase